MLNIIVGYTVGGPGCPLQLPKLGGTPQMTNLGPPTEPAMNSSPNGTCIRWIRTAITYPLVLQMRNAEADCDPIRERTTRASLRDDTNNTSGLSADVIFWTWTTGCRGSFL